ncbi:MAG TPA: cation:proton antiporter [Planctomycetota bacterium]|nr:cation:proton antiporter [Planctomycetota bacterium]
MKNQDFAHVLLALAHLLVAAHVGGYLFHRLRRLRVIGEIAGWLILGPTVLGHVAPDWYTTVFGNHPANIVLETVSKLGLMLLMFVSGLEIRSEFSSAERKSAAAVTVAGTVIPFLVALAAGSFLNFSEFYGPKAVPIAFNLVVAIAVAVTSIPVISKIMLDLGILETPFARIVLSAAVVEDVILYVVLSVALSFVRPDDATGGFTLPDRLGIPSGTPSIAYHVFSTLGFFTLAMTLGPKLFEKISAYRFNVVRRGSPAGYLLLFLIVFSGVAIFLDVELMFGAFLAGVVVAGSAEGADEPRRAVKQFSSAFFIPVFFAMVGWKLNLLRDVPWLFVAVFIAACCAVKAASVYGGARFAGVGRTGAMNLAAAMNARGGPGIVLASVALSAELIDSRFYVCLVLLAILTSLMAGTWLNRAIRSGRPLL